MQSWSMKLTQLHGSTKMHVCYLKTYGCVIECISLKVICDFTRLVSLLSFFQLIFKLTLCFKTSQLVSEILQKTIETKPTTLNDWTERLQQSFMVKWMCSGADFSFEEDMENDWKM
jgi:hypothetical protein